MLPFVAQSFMCVAHNNGGFSLFDVNFLFLLLLSQLLLALKFIRKSNGGWGGRQGLAGVPAKNVKI